MFERARRTGARSGWARLGVAALLLTACGGGGGDSALAERRLDELSRMFYVGAGSTLRLPGDPRSTSVGVVEQDLLVDRFEVSRGDWKHWTGALPEPDGLVVDAAQSHAGRESWPAYASFEEALAFAERRGMRLPTVAEWVFVASGGRGQPYPWGALPRDSVANTLELGLRRPLPVGTFENGRSPAGGYDLLGNVAEWAVADGTPVGDRYGNLDREREAVALGGSYLTRLRPVLVGDGGSAQAVGERLGLTTRGPDLGLRCVAEAERFLLEHGPAWGELPGAEARLRRLGERFGSPSVKLLERLATDRPEIAAIGWLLEGARR